MSSAGCDALFVSPHPDDIEIFCGGTVARLVSQGRDVRVADLTRGEMGSNGDPETRRQESLAAARALGVTQAREVVGLPDGRVHDTDPQQVQSVVQLLRELRPATVWVPWVDDRHPDHGAAGRLLRRATALAGEPEFDPATVSWRPLRLVHYLCHDVVEPTFFVDVSEFMASRRAALDCYGSQLRRAGSVVATAINDPSFRPGLEARLAAWGSRIGVSFAEAFLLSEPVVFDDPLDVLLPEENA